MVRLGEAARQGKSEKGGGEGVVDSIQHEQTVPPRSRRPNSAETSQSGTEGERPRADLQKRARACEREDVWEEPAGVVSGGRGQLSVGNPLSSE